MEFSGDSVMENGPCSEESVSLKRGSSSALRKRIYILSVCCIGAASLFTILAYNPNASWGDDVYDHIIQFWGVAALIWAAGALYIYALHGPRWKEERPIVFWMAQLMRVIIAVVLLAIAWALWVLMNRGY